MEMLRTARFPMRSVLIQGQTVQMDRVEAVKGKFSDGSTKIYELSIKSPSIAGLSNSVSEVIAWDANKDTAIAKAAKKLAGQRDFA